MAKQSAAVPLRYFATRRPAWHALVQALVAVAPPAIVLVGGWTPRSPLSFGIAAAWVAVSWFVVSWLLPVRGKHRVREWLSQMEQATNLATFENLLQPPIAVMRQSALPWLMLAVAAAVLAAVGHRPDQMVAGHWLLLSVALAVIGVAIALLWPAGPAYVFAVEGLRSGNQWIPWAEVSHVQAVGVTGKPPTAIALGSRSYLGQSWELDTRELTVSPKYLELMIRTTCATIDRILALPFDDSGMELDPSLSTDRGEDFLRHIEDRRSGEG